MGKTDNVKDLMVDIADAIRAKKGTSDLINPQDFSKEIASIEVGGSGVSGGGESGDEWRYFSMGEGAMSGMGGMMLPFMVMTCRYTPENSRPRIGSSGMFVIQYNGDFSKLEAAGMPMNVKYVQTDDSTPPMTVNDFFQSMMTGMGLSSETELFAALKITEITKEEFYNIGY